MSKLLSFAIVLLLAFSSFGQNSFRSHRYKLLSLNDITSYWDMDESSGNRTDAFGGNTLTDNGTVAASTGVIGNAADFEASNPVEYLSLADEADVSTGDIPYTVACWVNLESKITDRVVVGKREDGAPQAEWNVFFDVSEDDWDIIILDGTSNIARCNSAAGVTLEQWYFIVAGQDTANGQAFLYLDGNAVVTNSLTGTSIDGTSDFLVGTFDAGGTQPFDGDIDGLLWAKRLLTDYERRSLWNQGGGMQYYAELGSWDRRQ